MEAVPGFVAQIAAAQPVPGHRHRNTRLPRSLQLERHSTGRRPFRMTSRASQNGSIKATSEKHEWTEEWPYSSEIDQRTKRQHPLVSNRFWEEQQRLWDGSGFQEPDLWEKHQGSWEGSVDEQHDPGESCTGIGRTEMHTGDGNIDNDIAPSVIGGFKTGRMLGRGAFGKVYEVTEINSDLKFALKVILKDKVQKCASEVALQKRTQPNPHAVEIVQDSKDSQGNELILMEFLPDGTLRDKIGTHGLGAEYDPQAIFRQLAEGVQLLHVAGIVHKDLKFANIVCDESTSPPTVKLTDFGSAAHFIKVSKEFTRTKTQDVFDLGAIFHTCLSGDLPFPSKKRKPLQDPRAEELVKGMMQRDPESRYTIEEVVKHPYLNEAVFRNAPINQAQNLPATDRNSNAAVDLTSAFRKANRAFVIAWHISHGYLLLQATDKKKGLHWQLPGGHVDASDASVVSAAARELFEETGIDARVDLGRLVPACVVNGRAFFMLELHNSDSQAGGVLPLSGERFKVILSHEHPACAFEPNAARASNMVELHSRGACSRGLLMALGRV